MPYVTLSCPSPWSRNWCGVSKLPRGGRSLRSMLARAYKTDRVARACFKLFLGFSRCGGVLEARRRGDDFMIVSPRMCVDEGLRRYEPYKYHDSRPASL